MHRLTWFALLALTGCPPPARYVVADVTAGHAPVHGALVAAECGEHAHAAQRTDDGGRARLRLHRTGDDCALVVAKPGLPTVETGPVNVCSTASACPPTRVDLPPYRARPPMEVAQ